MADSNEPKADAEENKVEQAVDKVVEKVKKVANPERKELRSKILKLYETHDELNISQVVEETKASRAESYYELWKLEREKFVASTKAKGGKSWKKV